MNKDKLRGYVKNCQKKQDLALILCKHTIS